MPDFDLRNPNRVRALVGAFSAANQVRFHDASGAGYRFLADTVIALDPLNGQIAARLVGPLGALAAAGWRPAGADARRAGTHPGGAAAEPADLRKGFQGRWR